MVCNKKHYVVLFYYGVTSCCHCITWKHYVFVIQLQTAIKKALIQGKRESTSLVRAIFAGEETTVGLVLFIYYVNRAKVHENNTIKRNKPEIK